MWNNTATKEERVHRLLDDINHKATRHKRGTTEKSRLLGDLEYIEIVVLLIRKILDNPKRIYTEDEIEQENAQSALDTIRRMI